MAILWDEYRERIVKEMQEKYNILNKLAVPKLEKIVVNSGVGDAKFNTKRLEVAERVLTKACGQKALVTYARKAISNFKIRKGDPVGCMVTLRRVRMYEFLYRLINIVIPRIRDFRGLSPYGFDKAGNYSFGISEQVVFPEMDEEDLDPVIGMNINIVIANSDPEKSYTLLKLFGMPLKEKN